MGKIMASLARVLAKLIGKSGQPIIGLKVEAPPGWIEYSKSNKDDPQS